MAAFEIISNLEYENKKPSKRKLMNLLELSKSTYYDCKNKVITANQKNKKQIQEDMIMIFENSGCIYGANKILASLKSKYSAAPIPSRATISRYMHEIGLIPIIATRFNVKNKSESAKKFIYNNYLKYWQPEGPGTHFVTDITYIYTRENNWVYLLTYMDLYTRQIVSFDVHDTMDAQWVTKILNRVIENFPNIQLVHSDRGSQYKSDIYMQRLASKNIIQSYSKKGYPYDNAWIESFHKSIKQEKLKHFEIKNLQEAYKLCCEYILTFYNSKRIHSAINYMAPNEFAKIYSKVAI